MYEFVISKWRGYVGAFIGIAAITFVYRVLVFRQLFLSDINITAVALSFLLLVLIVASKAGHGPSIFASLVSTFCFNFFFLPPPFTVTVEDPHNWVALSAFLITAVVASQLWATTQSRTLEAEKSRQDIWKLYQLSRNSITTFDPQILISSIANQVQAIFGVQYAAVFEPTDNDEWRARSVASSVNVSFEPSLATIKEVALAGEWRSVPSDTKMRNVTIDQACATVRYLPLRAGTQVIGVMVLCSSTLEEKTLEAIAGLVAWSLERARILQEISRTEALRQSNELKSALLASVSHDLRTPLTSIRASIDSLLHPESNWDSAALHEFHLIISEEVSRLTRLIENLLAMARIEAGELRLSKKWESVPELCQNVLDRCAALIRYHDVNVELSESLPPVIMDSRLIAEALSNLVENAAKYSPPGTRILLKARMKGDELIISVTDHGPGVAPEDRNRLFEKFYRGTNQQNGGGTGMGLAIARGIIEAHQGRIWFESTPDNGATFAFSLKVIRETLAEVRPPKNSPE